MVKFIFMVGFMNFMLLYNNMIMFYYNLMYFISFMLIFIYMFKDMMLSLLVGMSFSVSYYSLLLIILSFWIVSLMLMCLNNSEGMKIMIFINLLMMLMLFFMSMDLMVFYLMFEVSLIPTFFLIIYWGGNPERLSASYYLMMYMLLVSFPLLIYIFNLYLYELTLKFDLLNLFMWGYEFSLGGYLVFYMAFFIKMPMYIMHIWLPKAHVEAPVYGSMILAGVLLKMGSYGLVRLLGIFIKSSFKYSFIIFSVGVIGSVLVSMVCMVQIDMKSLVAYSSVVHMNMMLCSFMTLFKLGFLSSYIMMVSHGLCSSGLFYMVNMYYSRTMSRVLLLNKGMMGKAPSLALWWFLLCVINFSFPFSLNFISEVFMLSVVLNWELFMLFYLVMVCFFSSAYSLYLFSYIQYGWGVYSELSFNGGLLKELMVVILHVYPLILILLNLLMFM